MAVVYFGRRFDAPALDGPEVLQFETPVGTPCMHCGVPITEDDCGYWRVCVVAVEGRPGESEAILCPIHLSCYLRTTLGSVAHLNRQCICYGAAVEPQFDGSAYDEGLAVLALVNEQRASVGLGPL